MSRSRQRPDLDDSPSGSELLRKGSWDAAQVAMLLDTPETIVARWCTVGLLPGAKRKGGAWVIPGAALFLFCQRRLEPHYTPETAAQLLDKGVDTVRGWLRLKRFACLKTGTAKSASVLIPESELIKWLKAGQE